jgi:surface polysaccharide O-acyltransferase-like enzyme
MAEQTEKKEIFPWIDLIRVVAVFLVVVVHVSGQLTSEWAEIPNDQWMIANVYGSLGRVSVPLFFMISGYLLMPRSEDLRTFCTKRMPKVLIPFVAWSLIYLLYYCQSHTCTASRVSDLLLFEGAYYHLWFLYSLIGIYLILPVFRLITRPDTDRQILWYFILLWLVFPPGLGIAERFWGLKINLSAPMARGFVGFFVFGYLLGGATLSRGRIVLSMLIGLLGLLATFTGTYLLTSSSGQFDGFFYEFVSLNVILASGAAFLLLRRMAEAKPFMALSVHAVTRALAVSTFGIYLVHVIVIEMLSDWIPFLHINPFMGNAIWSVPLVSVVVFLISFLIVRILQKIPLLKSIVP